MDKFIGIIIAAIAVEGLITYFKTFVVDKKIQWQMVLGIALGVFIAIAYQLDLMAIVGLKSTIPYVGMVITGTALSRGSNYVFDLIDRFTNWKKDGKNNPFGNRVIK